jgi:hypothetical protein
VGTPGASSILDVQVVQLADPQSKDLIPSTEVVDGEIQVSGGLLNPKGDADCDGAISSVDALAILRHVAGIGQAACVEAADVDCDGEPARWTRCWSAVRGFASRGYA